MWYNETLSQINQTTSAPKKTMIDLTNKVVYNGNKYKYKYINIKYENRHRCFSAKNSCYCTVP